MLSKHPSLSSFYIKGQIEAGCDEAGRGCLAGDVFAAAVILPADFHHPLLNDSKQMTAAQRETVRQVIEEQALCWAIGRACADEIDRLNILRASITAMHRALAQLTIVPDFILVDGNKFYPYPSVENPIAHKCFVKGDGRFASIAAASVLAKTHRDKYMEMLDKEFPQYGWADNKGYPTLAHRKAVLEIGPSPYHRRSFHIDNQPTLF